MSPRRAGALRRTGRRCLISIRDISPARHHHHMCIIVLALPYRGLFEIYIQYAEANNVATTDSLRPFVPSSPPPAPPSPRLLLPPPSPRCPLLHSPLRIDQILLLRVQIYYGRIIVCTFLFKSKLKKVESTWFKCICNFSESGSYTPRTYI